VIQKHYDELAVAEGEDDPQKAAEAEAMAGKMIELLTSIENDRLKYTEKRDSLKRTKQRCVRCFRYAVLTAGCRCCVHEPVFGAALCAVCLKQRGCSWWLRVAAVGGSVRF
jgi:hypothetical protein